jgi:predicted HTH domain antitoxin
MTLFAFYLLLSKKKIKLIEFQNEDNVMYYDIKVYGVLHNAWQTIFFNFQNF